MKRLLSYLCMFVLCFMMPYQSCIADSTINTQGISMDRLELIEGISVLSIPETRLLPKGITNVANGFVVGGYMAGDDYLAAMDSTSATISFFNHHLALQWTINDRRLIGALYDDILAYDDAIYFGRERMNESGTWIPSIMKLSTTGNIDWIFDGSEDMRISDFVIKPDGSVLCLGTEQRNDSTIGILVTIDNTGMIQAKQGFDEFDISECYSIASTPYGYMITGYNGTLEQWVVFFLRNTGEISKYLNIGSEVKPHQALSVAVAGNNLLLYTFADSNNNSVEIYYASINITED